MRVLGPWFTAGWFPGGGVGGGVDIGYVPGGRVETALSETDLACIGFVVGVRGLVERVVWEGSSSCCWS